jgi:hypothetical protein
MSQKNVVAPISFAGVAVLAALAQAVLPPRAAADPIRASTVTLVDSLGAASPTTIFEVLGGVGGISVLDNQFVGPQFVVGTRTVLTHVGGFLNNCKAISGGIPNCPDTSPLRVEIRASVNGVPDLSRVLASVPLSDDRDPLRVSFESASLRLPLAAGSYFALFVAEPGDAGFLLGSALDPFVYRPDMVRLGLVIEDRSSVFDTFAAARVLGEAAPVPEPTTLLLLGTSALALIARSKRRRNTPGEGTRERY